MSTDNPLGIPPVTVLTADPPWRFGDKLPGGGRGADKHYATLALHEIQRFAFPAVADAAMLVLWRVGAMVEEAYAVVRAWGFVPKSEIVWVKTGPGSTEFLVDQNIPLRTELTVHMGMGHYVRNAHEVAIVATRGRFEVADKGVRSVIFAPIGEHSEKPKIFYDLVERLGGPNATYVELFGRKPRPGWYVFGNELPGGGLWTPREPPPPANRCKGPGGSHRYGPQCLPDGTRLCEDCRNPEPGPPLLNPSEGLGVVVADAWATAQRRAEEEAQYLDENDEDLAELVQLPRHRVRRADGKIVLACCAACRLPQYASPIGVVCTNRHEGERSIPGCEFCGEADGHRLECEVLALPTEPPPASPATETPPPIPVLSPLPNPVLVAADAHNAAQGFPTRQSEPLQPAPSVPDAKRDELLKRAREEGLLVDADLAEGPDAAWIKLLYRAPVHWFPPPRWFDDGRSNGVPHARLQPGEQPLADLARDLGTRGLHVSLLDIAKWSPVRRDVARLWVTTGGDLPDWLSAFRSPPAHAPQCANGCIGAEAGCPAARHAWGQLISEEVVVVGPENMGELPRAKTQPAPASKAAPALGTYDHYIAGVQTLAATTEAAPPANDDGKPAKRGRGRPPGAKNKPKDAWAAAKAASAQSEDPEVEEGFFS